MSADEVIDFPIPAITQEQYETSLVWFWLEHFEQKRDQAKTAKEREYWDKKIDVLHWQGVESVTDATA